MDNRKYYHEISDEEIEKIDKQNPTLDELAKSYRQPDWCNMPLEDGCYSLFGNRKRINREFCKNCDFCKEK